MSYKRSESTIPCERCRVSPSSFAWDDHDVFPAWYYLCESCHVIWQTMHRVPVLTMPDPPRHESPIWFAVKVGLIAIGLMTLTAVCVVFG